MTRAAIEIDREDAVQSRRLTAVIVGFGRIADRLSEDPRAASFFQYATHAQAMASHPSIRWSGVADPSVVAQARARENWNIPFVASDARGLSAQVAPDLVVLAGPPGARLDVLSAFPTAQAAILEKPVGLHAAEREALLAYAESRNLLVQVNLLRRFDPIFRARADGGLEKRVGAVQGGTLIYGNGLRNNGSHLVDLVTWLAGDVVRVQAIGPGRPRSGNPIAGDLDIAFALHLQDGAVITAVAVDFSDYRELRAELWGTKGRLVVESELQSIRIENCVDHPQIEEARALGVSESFPATLSDAFLRLYDNTIESLAGAEKPYSPLHAACRVEAVIDAIFLSERNGGAVVDIPSGAAQA